MRVLKVDVIQADIDKGVRGNYERCPIACALNRQYGWTQPHVSGVTYDNTDKGPLYTTEREALDFMCDFDSGKHVKPCTLYFPQIVGTDK